MRWGKRLGAAHAPAAFIEPAKPVLVHKAPSGKLGLEGIVSKRVDSRYRSGNCRTWVKTKNPKAPA